ncbi:MAG: septal ring lytic transglycosylase RlpA family protein [Candidatus Nealsonbacteria bacterium]|nr:septal ring lytic transglycosylase RlpA family protein [Candidatus Nealsonbacteria bacterium]
MSKIIAVLTALILAAFAFPATAMGAEYYTVQPGDTLLGISSKIWGDWSNWQQIWYANQGQIANPNLIKAGQKLLIPENNANQWRFAQVGSSTWYGPGFEGKRTACGKIYDSGLLTAASNSLPCDTVARITNAVNGKSVVVTINDTGAFAHALDLSAAAFSEIASLATGVVTVSIELLR